MARLKHIIHKSNNDKPNVIYTPERIYREFTFYILYFIFSHIRAISPAVYSFAYKLTGKREYIV